RASNCPGSGRRAAQPRAGRAPSPRQAPPKPQDDGRNDMASTALDDMKVHVKLKLSALWAALMFCYVYGDYFGLYVPGKLKGMLEGDGPIGPVSQGTLVATSILLALPGLMVFLS